jgi:hypothetical protein
LLLSLLAAAPAARAADEAWSESDVEAASHYRDQERERAERYRARAEATRQVERPPAVPAPRSERTAAGSLGERLRAWFEGVLVELAQTIGDALRQALHEWFGIGEPAPSEPRRELAPRPPGGLGGWLRREQTRADDWLEGRAGAPAPEPEAQREWQQREAKRARELARREAKAARERARRSAELPPAERTRARWLERWQGADAWEREERAQAARQREAAAEWEAEERARLEAGD